MSKKSQWIIISVLSIALITMVCYVLMSKQKVAFVRSNDLVYGYNGMKEAQKELSAKKDAFKSNIDTLKLDLQRALNKYNQEFNTLSKEERLQKEKTLYAQQQNLKDYTENIQETVEKEDAELTQGVLNQINIFVEDYAKKNNYTMVFGTTTSGNIMYGEDKVDITKDVLKGLNDHYQPLPSK